MSRGSHYLGVQQTNAVAQRTKFARPMVSAPTGFNGNQARWLVDKVFPYMGALALDVDDFTSAHVHAVQLKYVLGNVETDNLQTIHGADDLSCAHSCTTIHDGSSAVFVKTVVYHALGTLMPHPSKDPPRLLKTSLPYRRPFMPVAFSGLVSLPVGREASIASRHVAESHERLLTGVDLGNRKAADRERLMSRLLGPINSLGS